VGDEEQLSLIQKQVMHLDSCMGAVVRHITGRNPKLGAMLDKTWRFNSAGLAALLTKLRFKKKKMAAVQEQIGTFLASVAERENLIHARIAEARELRDEIQRTLDMLHPEVYNLNVHLENAVRRHTELRDTISHFLITEPGRDAQDREQQPLLITEYKDKCHSIDEVLGTQLMNIYTEQDRQRYTILGLRSGMHELVKMTRKAQAELLRRNTPVSSHHKGCQASIDPPPQVQEVTSTTPPPPTALLPKEMIVPLVKLMPQAAGSGEVELHLPPNLHKLMVDAQPNMPVTLEGWKVTQPIVCRRSILQIYLKKLEHDVTADDQGKERPNVAHMNYQLMKNKYGLPSMTNSKILELLVTASQLMEDKQDVRCRLFCSLVGHLRKSKAVKVPKPTEKEEHLDAAAMTAKMEALNEKLNGHAPAEEEEEEEEEESEEEEEEDPDDETSNIEPLEEWKIAPLFRILKHWYLQNVLTTAAISEETNDGGWINFARKDARASIYSEFKTQLPVYQVQEIVREVKGITGARITGLDQMEELQQKMKGKRGQVERDSSWMSGQAGDTSGQLKRRNSGLLQARREKKYMVDDTRVEIDPFLAVVFHGCSLVWHRLREIVGEIFLAHADWFVQRQRDGFLIPVAQVKPRKQAPEAEETEGQEGKEDDEEQEEEEEVSIDAAQQAHSSHSKPRNEAKKFTIPFAVPTFHLCEPSRPSILILPPSTQRRRRWTRRSGRRRSGRGIVFCKQSGRRVGSGRAVLTARWTAGSMWPNYCCRAKQWRSAKVCSSVQYTRKTRRS
jgi:hypothetical protein